jgi:hypothetical protein
MVFRSLLSVLLGLLILPPAFSDEPIEFGKFRQLFLDDHVIASRSHIRRTLHQATPYGGNPVIEANKPWESGLAYHYGSVEWHLDRQSTARKSTNGRTGGVERWRQGLNTWSSAFLAAVMKASCRTLE